MKNKIQKLGVFSLLVVVFNLSGFQLFSNSAMAQSSIGLNFGVPQYTWSNDPRAPFVISESSESYALGIEYLQSVKNGLSWGVDGGVHRFSNMIRSNEEYGSYSSGQKPLFNLSLTPKAMYQIGFGESRISGFVSLGPSFQWNTAKDRDFDEENFRIVNKRISGSNGVVSYEPIEQEPYSGIETVKSFSVIIRPELGLTFKASDFTNFTARLQYGISLGAPLISREFNDFPLNGTQTSSQHNLRGDYWVIQVGYQVFLK